MTSKALPPNEVGEQVERESTRIHICDAIRHRIDEFIESWCPIALTEMVSHNRLQTGSKDTLSSLFTAKRGSESHLSQEIGRGP